MLHAAHPATKLSRSLTTMLVVYVCYPQCASSLMDNPAGVMVAASRPLLGPPCATATPAWGTRDLPAVTVHLGACVYRSHPAWRSQAPCERFCKCQALQTYCLRSPFIDCCRCLVLSLGFCCCCCYNPPSSYGFVGSDKCEPLYPSVMYTLPASGQSLFLGVIPRSKVGLSIGLTVAFVALTVCLCCVFYRRRKKLQAWLVVRGA